MTYSVLFVRRTSTVEVPLWSGQRLRFAGYDRENAQPVATANGYACHAHRKREFTRLAFSAAEYTSRKSFLARRELLRR
jgi:hypothetical protein